MIKIIERATGKVVDEYKDKNVKSYCKPEDIERARRMEHHELGSFIVELRNMAYDLAMWEVDKYDLVVVKGGSAV
jgi:hypothetical protein